MNAEPIRDFEVLIHPPPEPGRASPVIVHVTPDDRRAEGTFISPLTPDEVDEALTWMEQGLFDDDFVKELGGRLFAALFGGEVLEVYRASRGEGVAMRLRLVVDDEDAARIPWELLYDAEAGSFPALQAPFVRGLSTTEPARPLETDAPLRILVLDSFPRGVLRVQGQVEAEGIREALGELKSAGRVEVLTLPHATLSGLQNALREGQNPERAAPIHVLHFIGHARYDRRADRTVLLFETDDGEVDEVDPEALVNVLAGSDVRLAFLNACQTVQVTALAATRAFAPALLGSGVPAVIGMQVTVLDEVAAQVAMEFYSAIADNRGVDAAILDARRLVRGDDPRRRADMGVPVCYLRSATGQVIALHPPTRVPLTLATWREWVRQRATPRAIGGVLIGAVSLGASAIAIYEFVIDPELPPMAGDFNIAVADFAAAASDVGDAAQTEAGALARSVYETLDAELADLDGFQIETRAPADTGQLVGGTSEERARSAAGLAELINADVVVYGTLSSDGRSFEPEFYLSERKLVGAEELVGQYQLGTALDSPADIGVNPAARRDLRDSLLARAHALAEFVIGLSYFSINEDERAEPHLLSAVETAGWADADGKEIAYVFLGTVAGRQGKLDDARRAYDRALELNPDYSRAAYGLAEVRFQEARGTCESGEADDAGLREALDGYRAALEATDQPPLADIPAKVHFGVARVFVCLSQALVEDRWSDAEREFLAVIDEYERGNPRLTELAAEAHAGLGIVYSPAVDDPDRAAKYRQAAASFAEAIALTTQEDRRAIFARNLEFVCGRLAELNADDELCEEAA
jgi:tetratricopeptide (TPR) repeat protein